MTEQDVATQTCTTRVPQRCQHLNGDSNHTHLILGHPTQESMCGRERKEGRAYVQKEKEEGYHVQEEKRMACAN